jgi:hypothetical protein
MLRQPVTKSVSSIGIHSAMTNPKTPGETQNDVVSLVTAQVIDAETAQWEMVEAGIEVDRRKADARRKQLMEIEAMVAGEEVLPAVGEHHEYHIRVIQGYIDQPGWLSVPPEAQDAIRQHWIAHQYALQQEQMLLASGQGQPAAQQGTPPAGAAEAAMGSAAGVVASAVNAA